MKNNMRKILVNTILLGLLILSVSQTSAKWQIPDPGPMLNVHTITDWVYHDIGDLRIPTQFIGEFTPTNPGDDSGDPVKNEWKERLHEYY